MQAAPQPQDSQPVMSSFVYFALVLWMVAGIAAFILSLFCFGKSGSTLDKLIGLVIAVLFGPFYWIYWGVSKKYCR